MFLAKITNLHMILDSLAAPAKQAQGPTVQVHTGKKARGEPQDGPHLLAAGSGLVGSRAR